MGRAFEYRKARKFKRWAAMAKTFTRIGKEITIATKEGGADPDANTRLRAAIQNAKAANLPKDNIERAIKKATDKDQGDYKELVYEGYAPHGIAIIIDTATDNPTRTVGNIRSYFNKCNGSLGTSGSVEFLFEHKCYLRIADEGQDIEEMELDFIDHGAEEVFRDEDEKEIVFYGEFTSFGNLQKALDDRNLEITNSGFERIPTTTKELNEEQTAEVDKLLEKIEEDEDVQNVFHTMV